MERTEDIADAPERVLSFNELEQPLRDMPVEYGETPLEYPTPQPEEVASPAESEPATESSETEASPAEELETFTVEAVAEALQMDPKALYEQLQVPIGDGESMSLGDFKDRIKDVLKSEALLAEVQVNREKVETDLLHKNQALMLAQQEAGVEVTEQHLQRAAKQREAYGQLQDRTLTELVPDYAESAFRQDFDKKVAKRLEAMGYNKQEAAFMKDARLRLEFYRHQRLLDEVASVTKKRTVVRRNQAPKGLTRSSDTIQSIRASKDTQNQKVEALGRLL